jgi:hypothetical protein
LDFPQQRVPGDVAQLGERRLCKAEVVGSSPIVSIESRPLKTVADAIRSFKRIKETIGQIYFE